MWCNSGDGTDRSRLGWRVLQYSLNTLTTSIWTFQINPVVIHQLYNKQLKGKSHTLNSALLVSIDRCFPQLCGILPSGCNSYITTCKGKFLLNDTASNLLGRGELGYGEIQWKSGSCENILIECFAMHVSSHYYLKLIGCSCTVLQNCSFWDSQIEWIPLAYISKITIREYF